MRKAGVFNDKNLDKKFPLNGRNLQVGVDDHCDALLLVNKLFSNLLFSIFFRQSFLRLGELSRFHGAFKIRFNG